MPKILLFSFLFFAGILSAQNIDHIIAQKRVQLERIDIKPSNRITYISSNFAQPQITTTHLRDKVKSLAVTKVYYVYTAYKRSANFNQKKLDKERFEQLKTWYPILFESPLIEWEIIEQTGLDIHTDGEGYFHGFIIVHRPLPTKEGRKIEFDLVSDHFDHPERRPIVIEEDPIAKLLPKDKTVGKIIKEETQEASFIGGDQALLEHIQRNFETPTEVWKDRKDFWAKFTVIIDENGQVGQPVFKESYGKPVEKAISKSLSEMPGWNPKVTGSMSKKDTIDFEWRISYSPQLKGMYLKNGKPPSLSHSMNLSSDDPIHSSKIGAPDIVGGSVYKALENIPQNEKLAIVMDVTGSMANHIVSTSFWLNKNKDTLPFTSFTVFNDGDDKKDSEKEIGSTGGVYFTSFVAEYRNSIRTAMQRGNGGDYPENDIEAVLYAIRKDVRASGVLLIADNFSSVKDFELLNKVTLPISVLPCGLTGSINQNYLDIICKTGGKIFYEDQIIDPTMLSKGDSFTIRRTSYVFTGKKIEVVDTVR